MTDPVARPSSLVENGLNGTAAGDDPAATRSIALLHELAHVLRTRVRESHAPSPQQDTLARLQAANDRLAWAALQVADRMVETIRPWGAAAQTLATAQINDQHAQDLQDANGRLVLGAFKAQDLEREAEAINQQQFNFITILAHELRNPVAPIRRELTCLCH